MSKVCSRCRAEKPFAEFYVDRKAGDGFTHRCSDLFDSTIFPEQGEVAFPSGNGQTRAVGTLTGERR